MRVLSCDPGGTTGFALWNDGKWSAWWLPWNRSGAEIQTHLVGGIDALVMESFHISAQTARKSQDGLKSIELIGVGRYLAGCYETRFVLQSPSEAKTFADDRKLRAMNMWTKGKDHPRDATRHLLLFLSKEKGIDLKKLRAKLDASVR